MEDRNTQVYMEDGTKAPGIQPSPGLSSTGKETDAEATTSGVSQVVFADAAVTGSGMQPPSAPGGPEKGPGHMEASEEWPSEELGTQEQRLPASSGKKELSWTAQEGPGELHAGHHQANPETDLGRPPSWLPVTPEGLPQPGVETEPQQEREQPPSPVEDQSPGSWRETPQQDLEYQSPGHQAENASDTVQPTEPSCTLDSCGQPPGDNAPKQAGIPHMDPQEAVPEPGAEDLEDGSQEAMPLLPLTTAEEKTANSLFPSTSRPQTPKEGGEAVETQSAAGPLLLPEVRDIGERRELCPAQKRLQEPELAAGAQSDGNPWQGFMKCLLEVEDEEVTHRRASKARALTTRKSPRTLTPVSSSAPACSSTPGLPLALLQTPASTPATAPLWTRPMASGSTPVPMGALVPATVSSPVLPGPTLDLGWRRPELLPQSNDRSLSYTKARPEPEERSLLKLYQSCEEWSEERLTPRQEEAFRSYFEIFNGPGEVDAQSLKNILFLVGFSLTPAQVEDALMSADVDGDGHVDFKDFLAVMTDSRRFFCSVEQNALANMAPPNPHTLLFEILSLLVEMLALPEAVLEEITNYYQKKLKEGTYKARETESAIGRLRARRKLSCNAPQADSFEISERKVLRILSRIKQQNYAANLQSPYAQVPCIPLCPRLDKKTVRRKQGNHYVLDQCAPTSLSPDIRSLFFLSGPQGSREHSSDSGKWLGSLPARTH